MEVCEKNIEAEAVLLWGEGRIRWKDNNAEKGGKAAGKEEDPIRDGLTP